MASFETGLHLPMQLDIRTNPAGAKLGKPQHSWKQNRSRKPPPPTFRTVQYLSYRSLEGNGLFNQDGAAGHLASPGDNISCQPSEKGLVSTAYQTRPFWGSVRSSFTFKTWAGLFGSHCRASRPIKEKLDEYHHHSQSNKS